MGNPPESRRKGGEKKKKKEEREKKKGNKKRSNVCLLRLSGRLRSRVERHPELACE